MVHNLTDFFSNYKKNSAINLHYLNKHAACSKLETCPLTKPSTIKVSSVILL